MDQFPESFLEQSLQGESLFVPFQRAAASASAGSLSENISGRAESDYSSFHEGSLDVGVGRIPITQLFSRGVVGCRSWAESDHSSFHEGSLDVGVSVKFWHSSCGTTLMMRNVDHDSAMMHHYRNSDQRRFIIIIVLNMILTYRPRAFPS